MDAGRQSGRNGQVPSFDAARFHFRRLEVAFQRVLDADREGRSATAEREAFPEQMHAFRRNAQLVVVETHEFLQRRRRELDGSDG